MQRLASVLAVGLMVLTGFSTFVQDGADAKMQTYPVPSLPPGVPNGSEISNGANFLQHMNNGDTDGMMNDALAYIQDKGVDAINPKLGWLTFARDTGIYFGEMAMSAQQERASNWYQQMRGQGFTPGEVKDMLTQNPYTLPNRLFEAVQKNPMPLDMGKECVDHWKGNYGYMAAGLEVKMKFDAYVAQNTQKAQNDMLSNAGNSLHEFGNQTVGFIQWVWNGWFPPKPPAKPPEKPPTKPPVKPPKPPVKPPQKPPSNPAGDHPDDNQDVSTFQVTRERSLFNAYERLAQMRNDPDIIREMEQIRTMDRNVTENMVPNWRSEVWYISSQLYDHFTMGYEEFVAGLPEKALDAMDKYTLTITQKDLGIDIGKKIPDTTVRPFSMRAVKKAFEEEPSFVYSIMESYRAGIDDILKLPRVAVLQNGFWQSCGRMMAENNEPVLWVDANFENGTLAGCSVLIIPSGGLYGLDGSENLRSKLDRFVRNGGTLVVLAQQHGTEYGSVPGGLSGYGWIEDQSCQYNSVGITTYVPFLSGQDSPALSLNVDGYFTGWPADSTIVLSRTKNAQPAMLMYPHGKGRVVATSAYEDWAYDNHAASASGKKLLRDLVAWAVAPADLPEFAVGTGAVSLNISLANPGNSTATKAVFTAIDPDRNIAATAEQSVSIARNSTGSANWAVGAEQKSGIWWLDYALYNATGALLRQAFDAERFAVSKYKATPGGFSYHFSGVGFDITTESEYVLIGSDANFTVHIYNYDNETKNITVKFDWTHQILDQTTVTLPPNGKVDVNWTRRDAGSGRMWAWFYDENGRQLGVASKGVRGTQPSINVEVSADADSYGLNGTVRASVKVGSNTDLAARTTVALYDEMNGPLASQELPQTVRAGASSTSTFNLTIPETAMSGYLLLSAKVESYSNRGAGSTRLFYLGANGTLAGKVYDLVSNYSIPNAEVRLEGSWTTFTVRSDASGNYTADVPGACYRMVISPDGFNKARATVPVRPLSNNTRDLATTPGGNRNLTLGDQGIQGRVLTLLDGQGIGGAGVVFNLSSNQIIADADAEGRYSMLLPAGVSRVAALYDDLYSGETETTVFSGRVTELDIYFEAAIQTGRVLDIVYGTPVAGARLVFDGKAAAATDAQGMYRAPLVAGYHTVAVAAPSYTSASDGILVSYRAAVRDFFLHPTQNWTTGVVRDLVYDTVIAGASLSFDGAGPVTTDEGGRYRTLLPVGFHSVVLSAPGYGNLTTGFHLAGRSSDYDFWLEPLTRTVTGTVRDQVFDAPLPGVELSFDGRVNVTTDGSGAYTAPLDTGYHSVLVNLTGYQPVLTGIHVAPQSSPYDFFLMPLTTTIHGTVRDLIHEFPITGASVSFDGTRNTTTDGSGRYTMSLPTGFHSVTVGEKSYTTLATGIHVAVRSSDYDFYLTPPAFNLSFANGTVHDLVYGTPLAGVQMVFDGSLPASTDANGRYSRGLATGFHSVTLSLPGYDNLTTGFHLGGRASEYDFWLTPNTRTVTGTLRDLSDNSAVSAAGVEIDGQPVTQTDAAGGFSATLSTGLHNIAFTKTGYRPLATTIHVTARTGPQTFLLWPTSYTPQNGMGNLTGHVYDLVSGQPVPGITVWLDGWDRTTTDQNGSYAFPYPAGVYRLFLRGTDDHDGFDTIGFSGVAVYPGKNNTLDFHMAPRKGDLAGTIYDVVSGKPIPGIRIWYDGWDRVTTDANGTYSFRYYQGEKRLLVRGTDDHDELDTLSQPAGITVYRGRTAILDIYMDPRKGALSGTVRDLVSGEPAPGIVLWYDGWDRTTTDQNGTFSFTYYWGVYRLLLRGTDDYDEIDTLNMPAGIAVYRGRTSVMDFWMAPRKGNLTGTVRDAVSGQPVIGITIWYDGWDRVRTDENGTYSFRYYRGVNRMFVRGTDDYDEIDTYNQPAGIAFYRGRTSVMDFWMAPRKGDLTGTVRDAVSGQPVIGISIWYDGWDRVRTDENGTYSFRYYRGVNRMLVRGTDDHDEIDTYNQPAGIAFYRGRTSVMDFYMMPRKGTLSGTAYDVVTGRPAAGVGIWYDGWDRAVTDENGSYSFTYYAGVNRLLVRDNAAYTGWDTSSRMPGVAVYRGTRSWLDLHVTPVPAPSTGTIAGRVLDLSTGLPVNATFKMGGRTASADENGTYALTLPAGLNALVVSADGYETRSMQVQVPLIRTTKMDFWLTLLNGTGRFSGTVVDKSGNRTIPGAQVKLYCGWPEPLSFDLTADANGSFSAELPTRSYAITVNADGFKTFDGGVTVFKDRTAVRKLLLDRSGNFTPWPAEFELITLPQHPRFFSGDVATLDVLVRNIGDLLGEAEVNLSVPGMLDEMGTAFILPGSEDVVRFQFMVPDDLEEKRYKAYYTVLGRTYEQNITVVGMKLDVSASLDKRMYLAGDTATVKLSIANLKNFDGQFFSRVKYGDYDMSAPFNLSAMGNATLTFQVPVKNASLERLFYSVYFASGRSLYINSMYIFVKPAGDLLLYTDRQLYKMGETAAVTLETTSSGRATITTDWFNTTVDIAATKSLSIPIPKLRSGTYFVTYVLGSFRGSYPIDVDGYSARATGSRLQSATLDVGAKVEITIDADSNLALQGSINGTIIDPAGNEVSSVERPWNLSAGENRGTFSLPFPSTESTGIHSVAYTYFADLDGKRTPLFSGRRAFDAVDRAAPNVTGTFPSKTKTKSIVVTIYTNEKTTCVVEYGAGLSYGKVAASTRPGRIHSVVLTNLSEGKTYHYRVKATDLSGNEVVYRDMTAKTSVPVAVQPGTDPLLAMALVVVVIGTVIGALVIRRRPR
jgi:hypothetical protein